MARQKFANMDQFHFLSTAFLNEFSVQDNASFDNSLEIVDLRQHGRGRGIIAKQTIQPDTELFVIPRDYVMSVELSPLYQAYPHVFEEIDEALERLADEDDVEIPPKAWLELIVVLVYDYFHCRESRWKAYWDVLPMTFDTLMFWTDEELDQLQSSAVRRHIGKEKANRMFQGSLIPVIQKNMSIFCSPSVDTQMTDLELLSLCHRMGSLIMSYAFDLEAQGANSDDERETDDDGWTEDREANTSMGMVPMADMLNADAEFNAHLEHETDKLVMRSLREIKAGEEVLNYYGPLPNCDLARRYGYTTSLHARYDVVEIPWTTITTTIQQRYQTPKFNGTTTQTEETIDEEEEETFVLERESGDPDETGSNPTIAKFTSFPDDMIEQTTAVLSSILQANPSLLSSISPKSPDSDFKTTKTTKIMFLHVMNDVLAARLQEYATSLEEDQTLLRDHASEMSTRMRMAVDIRMGEKQLLREAQQLVEELLRKYGVAPPAATSSSLSTLMNEKNDEPRAKRRKVG